MGLDNLSGAHLWRQLILMFSAGISSRQLFIYGWGLWNISYPHWHVSWCWHWADFIQLATLPSFHGCSFPVICIEDTLSQQPSRYSWVLQSFCSYSSLPQCFLGLTCRDNSIHVIRRDWTSHGQLLFASWQFGVSAMVIIYCTRSFFAEGWELHLSVDLRMSLEPS